MIKILFSSFSVLLLFFSYFVLIVVCVCCLDQIRLFGGGSSPALGVVCSSEYYREETDELLGCYGEQSTARGARYRSVEL
jgi:hypothetical protein